MINKGKKMQISAFFSDFSNFYEIKPQFERKKKKNRTKMKENRNKKRKKKQTIYQKDTEFVTEDIMKTIAP